MRPEKLDPGLTLAHQASLSAQDADRAASLSVMLYFDGGLDAVEAAGFEVHWAGAGEAVGTLRLADLGALTDLPNVLRIAAGRRPRARLDTAALEVRARVSDLADIGTEGLWHVEKPAGTLTTAGGAGGAGVIVAVIDTGIDVSHPSFCSVVGPPAFTSRILKVWDMGLTPSGGEAGPPVARLLSGHTYGVEYKTAAIKAALDASGLPASALVFKHRDCIGHGTHVASIAAGGSRVAGGSDGSFVGIAPEADIIAVRLLDLPDEVRDTAGTVVTADVRARDAVIYVLREARALGKAVVINASFGNSSEPGDGLGDTDVFLDDVFDPAKAADGTHFPSGAIFVKSAGNEGDVTDSAYATVVIPDAGQITVPFELFDDRGPSTTDFVNCQFVQYVPDMWVTAWYREVAPPHDVSVAARVPTEASFSAEVFSGFRTKHFDGGKQRTLFHDSLPVSRPRPVPPGGTVRLTRNRITLLIEPKKLPAPAAPLHAFGIYELRFTGPPGTVLHVAGTFTGTSAGHTGLRIASANRDGTPLPGPEIVNGSATPVELIDITSRHTMMDGGGRNVITVAAYDDITGKLAEFSSRGPLRDFSNPTLGPVAAKPDIAGPGVLINASMSAESEDGLGHTLVPGSVAGNRFTEMSGTSMSTPVVTGIVALMLQKNAALTVDDVRTALATAAAPRAGSSPGPADPGYAEAFGPGRAAALESRVNTP